MIYFILPFYNEEQNLDKLLKEIDNCMILYNFDYKMILIDDGSIDKSIEIIRNISIKLPYEIISHKTNLGLGSALKSGFEYVIDKIRPEDIVITMDSDNSHPPEITKDMVEKILNGNDVVIASRYCPGGKEIGLKLKRKIMSRVINKLLKLMFYNKNVKDYTCGYRALSGKLLIRLKESFGSNIITEKGFTATVELLLKCISINSDIYEVPLILRYDKKKGKSKIKILRTILQYIILIFRLKFSNIITKIIKLVKV